MANIYLYIVGIFDFPLAVCIYDITVYLKMVQNYE